jgi:PEP-CTERM motif-containing protein
MKKLFLSLFVISLLATNASALLYDIDKDPGHILYGNLWQNSAAMQAALGVPLAAQYCGPVAVTNSFRYLENKYPLIYGNNLTGGNLVGTAVGLGALMGTNLTGTWWDDLIWYKMKGIEAKVPGMTIYEAQHMPGWNWNIWDDPTAAKPAWVQAVVPTWQFLWQELYDCEDVEILMNWDDGGHFVTPKSFHWNDINGNNVIDIAEGATFDYIDPWTGAVGVSAIWQGGFGGILETNYAPGAQITMIVSESPVPEPATLVLLALGGLLLRKKR